MDNKNQDKHNLENVGNVMGQTFDTGKYDQNYNRKKGMRFFLIMLILIVIASVIILNLRKYPAVKIVFAGDSGIAVHHVKTNTLGKSRLADEEIIEYNYEGYVFGSLDGKTAQIAYVVMDKNAEFLVAEADVLDKMADRKYFIEITHYIENLPDDRLLTMERSWVGTMIPFNYGAKILDNRYYDYIPEEGYVAAISREISLLNQLEPTYIIHDFTQKLAAGEPYRYGRRTYGIYSKND